MTEININFWKRVNSLIKSQKITQSILSLQCGFNERRINNLSSGNRLPDANEAVAIATALNTTVEYLVTGIPPTQNKTFQEVRVLLEKTLSLLPPNF